MALFSPPPIITPFVYQSCRQINDPVTRKRVYETPTGEKLPSVTTVLGETKDMTHLYEWRRRVGEEQATQITREAAGRGTSMHKNLECFVTGIPRPDGNNLVHRIASKMADTIIEHGLRKINEIWAIEQSLYFPGLYSGTTDGIGVFEGEPCVFDYKQTNHPKKVEYIDDYFIQLLFYGTAHNEVYKTNIKKGVIFMAVAPTVDTATGIIGESQYQEFTIEGALWDEYEVKMLDRLEQYYKNIKPA